MAPSPVDTTAFTLGVERRYPLRLDAALPELARLYREACTDVWDPEELVDAGSISGRGDDGDRRAAAAVWGFASKVDYTGITESDALLVRFCIEESREPELKYLLTSRGQARALSAEACSLVVDALGGKAGPAAVAASPPHPATLQLLNAGVPADALVCVRLVVAEAVDTALLQASLAFTEPPALRAVTERLLVDRRRLLAFGLAYAGARLPSLDPAARAGVAAAAAPLVDGERLGPRCPALTPGLAEATARAAGAGLGGVLADVAADAVAAAVASQVEALASLGVELEGVQQ